MPKSLGQIHTVNQFHTFTGLLRHKNISLSEDLTRQLQHQVRQGNIFKMVGIDLSLTTTGTLGGGQVSGEIRYYSPTKGRCEAYRGAYRAVRNAMELQGINPSVNKAYDFRIALNNDGPPAPDGNTIGNQATLDGDEPLVMHGAGSSGTGSASVFDIHNQSVTPLDTTVNFPAGYNTMGVQASPTDFVLGDTVFFAGNDNFASTDLETIPFMMSWTPDTTDLAITFNWRPDPALYLAIMTGELQIFVEELNLDGGAPSVEMHIAVQVAGWSSMMGKPKSRSRQKSKSKK